ncbi:hypothetical protein AB0B89_34335 [Sphaerisporangium sp. NPDC049002]|uniref:hypothetical protein n=1 Tax=Sphaerisporangium sp. NPDC049002 TaxID=3155392 RepID=UPI0033DC9EB9
MSRRGALRLGRNAALAAAAGTALGAFTGTPRADAEEILAAPKIIGPVTVISPSVRVDNAHYGSTVNLFAEGAPIASVPASADGVTLIPVGGLGLSADKRLTATQTATGTRGEPSRPEPVQAAPKPLGAVYCASLVHACMDWLVVTGAAPGATVAVRYGGVTVGEAVADWPDWTQVSVLLDKGRTGPFGVGTTLQIKQHYVDPAMSTVCGEPPARPPPPRSRSRPGNCASRTRDGPTTYTRPRSCAPAP